MSLVHLFLSPKGRIGRRDFWLATVALMAIMLPATWLLDPAQLDTSLPSPAAPGLALTIVSLLLLWPSQVVMLKRFNDRRRPRWIVFMVVAAWGAFTVAQHLGPMPDIGTLPPHQRSFFHALGLVVLWVMIELGVLPGRPDAGEPPPAAPPPALARTSPECATAVTLPS